METGTSRYTIGGGQDEYEQIIEADGTQQGAKTYDYSDNTIGD